MAHSTPFSAPLLHYRVLIECRGCKVSPQNKAKVSAKQVKSGVKKTHSSTTKKPKKRRRNEQNKRRKIRKTKL